MTSLDLPPPRRALARSDSTTGGPPASRRKRGRPLEMTPEALLDHIRILADRDGLFRVHDTHSGLYARARRQFGSWSQALRAAGVSYEATIERARSRSRETRAARRRRVPRPR